MRINFKVGKAYFVTFLDHTHGTDKLATVQILGWCIKDTKESVVFSAWKLDSDDKSYVDNNHEQFSLVKSCIKKKRVISGV